MSGKTGMFLPAPRNKTAKLLGAMPRKCPGAYGYERNCTVVDRHSTAKNERAGIELGGHCCDANERLHVSDLKSLLETDTAGY
jgi:hypothetical protein